MLPSDVDFLLLTKYCISYIYNIHTGISIIL
jgi:hypothetical protein